MFSLNLYFTPNTAHPLLDSGNGISGKPDGLRAILMLPIQMRHIMRNLGKNEIIALFVQPSGENDVRPID